MNRLPCLLFAGGPVRFQELTICKKLNRLQFDSGSFEQMHVIVDDVPVKAHAQSGVIPPMVTLEKWVDLRDLLHMLYIIEPRFGIPAIPLKSPGPAFIQDEIRLDIGH